MGEQSIDNTIFSVPQDSVPLSPIKKTIILNLNTDRGVLSNMSPMNKDQNISINMNNPY